MKRQLCEREVVSTQKLSKSPKQLSFYSLACKARDGSFLPFVHPDETNAIQQPCNTTGSGVVSCKHPKLKSFIDEVHSLDFLSVINKAPSTIQLPFFIPVISRGFFSCDSASINSDVIGISLKDIFTSPPKRYLDRLHVSSLEIKKNLLDNPLFQNKKVILFSSGPDALIEKVWNQEEELDFFVELAKMGFELATAMNFSVFFGECPVGHAINLKKGLQYFASLQNVGIQSIPHLYWANKFHLERWLEWLKENAQTNLVSVNCQMSRLLDDCRIIAEGIKWLSEKTGEKVHFLLEGPRKTLINRLSKYHKYIHIAMKEPAMVSFFHKKYVLINGNLKRLDGGETPIAELIGPNIETYKLYLYDTFKMSTSVLKKRQKGFLNYFNA